MDKIDIIHKLQKYVVKWYHTYLLHTGLDLTEVIIRQHLYWPGIIEAVHKEVTGYDTCQHIKWSINKYGKSPANLADKTPWNKLSIDLLGPYIIRIKGKEPLILEAVTMIYPVTGWFEVAQYSNKKVMTITSLVETTWLVRFLWPVEITYD